MGYPNGVSLAVVSGGTAFTAFGDDVPVQITVTPRFPKQGGGFLTRVVHAASGWVMTSDPDTFTAEAGTEVSFSVPHVDQAGFRDPAQNAYTGWYYEVKVVVGAARGRTKTAYTQTVSPIVGQALVDLDLVPEGQTGAPQSVAVPEVVSVNGMTGAVTIEAGGASDTDIAAFVADPSSATRTVLDESYATRSPNLIDSLPDPFFVSHRGGPDGLPEGTLEAYRINDSTGIDVLEADVQRLGDGTLVVLHDATVDRTTDGTGLATDYTLPTFKALNAADGMNWPTKVAPATLDEFMKEFGHSRALQIEPKSGADLTEILDKADRFGVFHNVQIETNQESVAQAAIDRGAQVWFYYGMTVDSDSVTRVVNMGVQHLATSHGTSDADIAKLVDTGLPVTVYTVRRRLHRDKYLSLGVQGISTDNPAYISRNTAMVKRDSWRHGVLGHGMLSNVNKLPSLRASDKALILDDYQNPTGEWVYPGEMMPIAAAGDSYTIDVDLGWETLPDNTGKALGLVFCIPDDNNYVFAGGTTPERHPNAYQAYFRASGQFQLYKLNASVNGSVSSSVLQGSTLNTPAPVAGEWCHIRATVTPTEITISRTDTDTPFTHTITDSDYRGGYFVLQRVSETGVGMFKNLVVS